MIMVNVMSMVITPGMIFVMMMMVGMVIIIVDVADVAGEAAMAMLGDGVVSRAQT
jgi:hypothetical protein